MTLLSSTTENAYIDSVREGLSYEAFEALRDKLELTSEDLARILGIPRRTVAKRAKDGRFRPSESNALARVDRIYTEAEGFFEQPDRTLSWLKTPLPALGAAPLELLDTDPGAAAVSELLTQLAWGIYP